MHEFQEEIITNMENKKQNSAIDQGTMPIKQFDVKTNHRFIFDLPGLDSFLVKSVKLPTYYRDGKKENIIVVLHDSIAPSASQQLNEIVKNNVPLTGKIKWLDVSGTIVSECKLDGLLVEKVENSLLSYESNDPSTMIVEFSFLEFTLCF